MIKIISFASNYPPKIIHTRNLGKIQVVSLFLSPKYVAFEIAFTKEQHILKEITIRTERIGLAPKQC